MTEPSGPIHILLVVDDDVLDRLGSVIRHLCVGMTDEPVRITVLSRSTRHIEDAVGPSRVITIPRTYWSWRRPSALDVLNEFDLEEPQIVHCLSAELAEWARPWCMEWDSSLVVQLTDLHDIQQWIEQTPFARGGKEGPPPTVIVHTAMLERILLQSCPQMHDWTRVVPLGIPAEPEPCCLAQPERIPAVLITSPLTRDCGLDRVFRSMQTIVRSGRQVHLFVLSSGPAERQFRQQATELGLTAHVTFAGELRDWAAVTEAMHGADFYIMPGPRCRFTIARLAAIAGGLAVLAPVGTIEDYLIDGTTACLFDPLRPEELTQKWAALLDDRSAARELAQRALDYVRAHHQASAMVTAMSSLYRQLVSGAAVTT